MSASYQMPSPDKEISKQIAANAKTLATQLTKIAKDDNRTVNFYAELGPYGASLHDGSEYTGSYMDSDDKNIHKTIVEHHRGRMELLLKADETGKSVFKGFRGRWFWLV